MAATAAALVTWMTSNADESLLIGLTNRGAPSAVTIDSDNLTAACENAVATFARMVGTYNPDTHAEHYEVASQLAIAFLYRRTRGGAQAASEIMSTLQPTIAEWKRSRRLTPTSNSPYRPTAVTTGTLPVMDDSFFDGYVSD